MNKVLLVVAGLLLNSGISHAQAQNRSFTIIQKQRISSRLEMLQDNLRYSQDAFNNDESFRVVSELQAIVDGIDAKANFMCTSIREDTIAFLNPPSHENFEGYGMTAEEAKRMTREQCSTIYPLSAEDCRAMVITNCRRLN